MDGVIRQGSPGRRILQDPRHASFASSCLLSPTTSERGKEREKEDVWRISVFKECNKRYKMVVWKEDRKEGRKEG